jgi:transcriptional regulator with GAF, ATPase, and Fis domain
LPGLEEEKRKSEEKIKNYRDNIQSLVNVGETALSGKRFDEVFMAVYREMKKMMDISLFGVGILNKENGMLEFRNLMIRNERAPFLKFPADDPERLPVYSLINDEVVFVKDITLEYKKYVSEMKPLPGDIDPRSVMVMPLKVDGTVLGVLAVQSEETGAYDDYHLGIAKVTAAFLSAFLYRDADLTK